MELTDEQKERIRINREAALELRRKRLEEEETKKRSGTIETRGLANQESPTKKPKTNDVQDQNGDDDDVELEAFEEGASEYVTKQDAMKIYCLPAATVEMCAFIEKENPRNKAWSSMKLYRRNEIRRRAHKRFGGLAGLVAERSKRESERFQKDMESTKNLFR